MDVHMIALKRSGSGVAAPKEYKALQRSYSSNDREDNMFKDDAASGKRCCMDYAYIVVV
jgi:hypothetical protein